VPPAWQARSCIEIMPNACTGASVSWSKLAPNSISFASHLVSLSVMQRDRLLARPTADLGQLAGRPAILPSHCK
jgi:hypothetical protein